MAVECKRWMGRESWLAGIMLGLPVPAEGLVGPGQQRGMPSPELVVRGEQTRIPAEAAITRGLQAEEPDEGRRPREPRTIGVERLREIRQRPTDAVLERLAGIANVVEEHAMLLLRDDTAK